MQYGFRPSRSFEHVLLELKKFYWTHKVYLKFHFCCVSSFEKLMKCAEHSVLPKKLEHYVITSTALQWMRSYLENRMQLLSINDT